MASVGPWMLGRHITHLSVTMQTVTAATGALADSAVIATLIDSDGTLHTDLTHLQNISDVIEWTLRNETENIVGVSRNRANHVRVRYGGEFTLTEILRTGNDQCRLAACWFEATSRIAKIKFGRAGNLWTLYAKMSSYTEDYQRGKNVGVATFRLIDANTAPTYTTAQE